MNRRVADATSGSFVLPARCFETSKVGNPGLS